MISRGICRECEAELEYSETADLRTLECPSCGERACSICNHCDEPVSPADLAARRGHEQCQEAEAERDKYDRERDNETWREAWRSAVPTIKW